MKYNVHLYREMKLFYPDIEAGSMEEAAGMAQNFLTEEAASVEDCDGENIAALIDLVGDEEYSQTRLIDYKTGGAK